jgi:hypothetical protein
MAYSSPSSSLHDHNVRLQVLRVVYYADYTLKNECEASCDWPEDLTPEERGIIAL